MKTMMRRLLLLALLVLAGEVAADTSSVAGTYRANGKDATPVHALALHGSGYMDKPTLKLVLSEKDAGGDPRADFKAQMGDLGGAIVVTLVKDEDGYTVIGSEFAHPALKRSGASAVGILDAREVKLDAGQISGRLVSREGAQLFDEALEIDLRFRAKTP